MITIIDGAKGSGKTKKIIDSANDAVYASKGDIVFLSTTKRYRSEIKPQIKFINTVEDEGIKSKEMLIGFIKGMLAANYDIEYLFIDGVYKMMSTTIDSAEMEELFDYFAGVSDVKITLTISCDRESLPAFIAKYLA